MYGTGVSGGRSRRSKEEEKHVDLGWVKLAQDRVRWKELVHSVPTVDKYHLRGIFDFVRTQHRRAAHDGGDGPSSHDQLLDPGQLGASQT